MRVFHSEEVTMPASGSCASVDNAPFKTGDDDSNYLLSSEELAAELGLPMRVVQPALVGYRSVGFGLFGAVMRWGGMVCRCDVLCVGVSLF